MPAPKPIRKVFLRPKKSMATPRSKVSSTIKDITDTPLFVLEKTPKGWEKKQVNLLEWWQTLTRKQKRDVLKTARYRQSIMSLFRDPSLNETDIARKLRVSRERASQYRRALMPARDTYLTKARNRAGQLIAAAKANPTLSWPEISQTLGFKANPKGRAQSTLLAKMGFKKRNSRSVRAELEQPLRRKFLEDKGIYYNPKKPIEASLHTLQKRYSNMQKRWEYKVTKYVPFLRIAVPTVNRNIAHLNKRRIDWENDRLNDIVGHTPAYVDKQLAILDSIDASSDLHYVLLKKLSGRVAAYGKEKFASLREAVARKDYVVLRDFAGAVVRKHCNLRQITPSAEFFEVGKETTFDVLSNCRHPEKDPAAFLAIASAAIELNIKDAIIRYKMERSEASLSKSRRASLGYS